MYVECPKDPALPAEYPVDGDLYPVDGLTLLTPLLGFDRLALALLLKVPPVGRLSVVCAELRLRIEEAPFLADWELNPLAGWDMAAVAFPICLAAGSMVPNPLVVEFQKWFEINAWCPWKKKPLWKSWRQKNPGNQNPVYQNG